MSYCDRWMPVVFRVLSVVNNWFEGHLPLIYRLYFDQTYKKLSLFLPSSVIVQMGRVRCISKSHGLIDILIRSENLKKNLLV